MPIKTLAPARLGVALALVALAAGPARAGAAPIQKSHATTLATIRVAGLTSATPGVDVGVDPGTGRVTVKIPARRFEKVLAPTVRPSRLQVSEDGVAQEASVDVEHAPVSVAVLVEMGGRSRQLAEVLESEVPSLIRPLFDRLGPQDRVGLFTYDRELRTVFDFRAPADARARGLERLDAPVFSESNLYDAVVDVLERIAGQSGRRAVFVLTTGIDTFSQASYAELLTRVRAAGTPIYVLTLGDLVRQRVFDVATGPLGRVDWDAVGRQCHAIAEASGGRGYARASALTAPAIFDDVLERLRVTYVLSYVSPRLGAGDRQTHVVEVRLGPPDRRPAGGRAVAVHHRGERDDRREDDRPAAPAGYDTST